MVSRRVLLIHDACGPGRGYPVAGSTAWQQEQAQPRTKGMSFWELIQTCIYFIAFDMYVA